MSRAANARVLPPFRLHLLFDMTHVLPGENIPAQHVNLKLGPGLTQTSDFAKTNIVLSTRAGELQHTADNRKWWIEGNSRRVSPVCSVRASISNSIQYVPSPQESVIGIVIARSGESWRVDIGSAHPASLDSLAFEGANKRNKPNLKVRPVFLPPLLPPYISQVGTLLYARVSLAHKDMEPELECFDAQTRKAEGFGELKGGFLVKCSLQMSRRWVILSALQA